MSSFTDKSELSRGLEEFRRAFEEYDGALNLWTPPAQALDRLLMAALSQPVDAAARREIEAAIAALESGDPLVRDFHFVQWAMKLARRLLAMGAVEPAIDEGAIRAFLDEVRDYQLDALDCPTDAERRWLDQVGGALETFASNPVSPTARARLRDEVARARAAAIPRGRNVFDLFAVLEFADRVLASPLAPGGGPGAKRIEAPAPFALTGLDAAIRSGIRPGPEALRAGLVDALNAARAARARPAYDVLLAAALLTGDPALRRDVLSLHQGRDLDAYHRQKDSGMSEEDLGYRPTEESSARIVGDMVRAWLGPIKSPLAAELLKKL